MSCCTRSISPPPTCPGQHHGVCERGAGGCHIRCDAAHVHSRRALRNGPGPQGRANGKRVVCALLRPSNNSSTRVRTWVIGRSVESSLVLMVFRIQPALWRTCTFLLLLLRSVRRIEFLFVWLVIFEGVRPSEGFRTIKWTSRTRIARKLRISKTTTSAKSSVDTPCFH